MLPSAGVEGRGRTVTGHSPCISMDRSHFQLHLPVSYNYTTVLSRCLFPGRFTLASILVTQSCDILLCVFRITCAYAQHVLLHCFIAFWTHRFKKIHRFLSYLEHRSVLRTETTFLSSYLQCLV